MEKHEDLIKERVESVKKYLDERAIHYNLILDKRFVFWDKRYSMTVVIDVENYWQTSDDKEYYIFTGMPDDPEKRDRTKPPYVKYFTLDGYFSDIKKEENHEEGL